MILKINVSYDNGQGTFITLSFNGGIKQDTRVLLCCAMSWLVDGGGTALMFGEIFLGSPFGMGSWSMQWLTILQLGCDDLGLYIRNVTVVLLNSHLYMGPLS